VRAKAREIESTQTKLEHELSETRKRVKRKIRELESNPLLAAATAST